MELAQRQRVTVNWTSQNSTLGLTQFYNALSVDPTNVNRMFGGAQDNGPQAYTDSLTWNGVAPCGDGGFSAIDPLVPNTVYVSGHGPCVEKSTTGGGLNTFSNVAPTIASGDRIAFIPPVVLDPSSPSNVYVGANRVYQSTDGATTWTAISPDLTLGGTLAIVAVAPSDSNTIYTGSNDSLIAFTNNALSGTSSTWFGGSLATRAVTDIKVDATTAATAYATYGGFSGFTDSVGHVFKTTDGGNSWTDISGNLPNIPVTSIAIDPDVANTYYVGTDVGAFYTSDGGTTWSVLGTGLPNVGIMSMDFQHATRTLVAGTHGRSAWELSLATGFTLTVTEAGTGSGSVTSSPSGITCPSTCSATYSSGTVVTLTATATAGQTFAGWSGACSGTGTCKVTMSAAKAVTATFNKGTSTTTVVSSKNPSTVGQSVTFTATVGPTSPAPTGTVAFTSNGTSISGCSAVTVTSSRTAACTTTTLIVGTDTIKASYSGDSNYSSSSGTVTQTVNKGTSTTTVVSSKNPSTAGQSVTFTATVGPASPAPTGTVAFTSNGTSISGCSAVKVSSSRTAACTTTTLIVGTDTIKASYSGDSNYTSSSGTVTQTVNKATSTTKVVSSKNPSTAGQSVTFTATVTPVGPPTPTGTVAFTSNGTTISGCSAVKVTSSRTAACTTTTLATGIDTIKASYSGDSNYTSSSGTVTQTVNKATSTTTVVSSKNPSTSGQSVTFTATVAPVGPPVPTGTVAFTSNGTSISGCSAVKVSSSRTAACTTTTLKTGTDTIKASYSGDSNYTTSSGTLSQVVN